MENDPDIVAMVGASAALTISGLPFMGPVGAARVAFKNGEYTLNPLVDDDDSELDLVVAGTREGVLMVESEANELSEEVMLGAVMFGHRSFQPVIDAIIELAEQCAKEPWDLPAAPYDAAAVKSKLLATVGEDIKAAYTETEEAGPAHQARRRQEEGDRGPRRKKSLRKRSPPCSRSWRATFSAAP